VDIVDNASSFTFSPDSKTLFTGGGVHVPNSSDTSGWLGLWNPTKGTLTSTVLSPAAINSMAMSADGKTIVDSASVGNAWKLELRDGTSGAVKGILTTQPNGSFFSSVAISRDGSTVALAGTNSAGTSSLYQIWSAVTGKKLFDLSSPLNTAASSVSFSPDGTMLAVACSTLDQRAAAGFIQVWNPKTGKLIGSLYPDIYQIERLCFSPDGAQLVVAGLRYLPQSNIAFGAIQVMDLASGEQVASLPIKQVTYAFGPLFYSSDGKLIYAGVAAGIEAYDAKQFSELAVLAVGSIYGGMAASPDGKLIAYSGQPEIGVLQSPIDSFRLSTLAVTGGASLHGTIRLLQPAPASGVNILLATSSPNVLLPGSVFVPAGQMTGQFSIGTYAVPTPERVDISAETGGFSSTSVLSVSAPALISVSVTPTSVKGGHSVVGKVTIGSLAPASGLVVALRSSLASVTVPTFLTIPSGALSATFEVKTNPGKAKVIATISTTTGGVTKTATVTVL
jgi:hypothetical protein